MTSFKEDMWAHRHRWELTDTQQEKIKNPLPGKKCDAGRTAADNHLFVNAVVYMLKTGVSWAGLPARFYEPDIFRKRFDH